MAKVVKNKRVKMAMGGILGGILPGSKPAMKKGGTAKAKMKKGGKVKMQDGGDIRSSSIDKYAPKQNFKKATMISEAPTYKRGGKVKKSKCDSCK